MTLPLMILAVLSVISAYGTGHYFIRTEETHHAMVPILAILAFAAGAGGGWLLYTGQTKDPILIPLFRNKFYFDELYAALIAGTQDLLATISNFLDKWLIDGVGVRGSSGATWGLAP